jgi:release factor glutamine methyltransferase
VAAPAPGGEAAASSGPRDDAAASSARSDKAAASSGRGGVPVRDALDSAVVAIGASGSESPRLDAELLLAHALGVTRSELFMEPQRLVGGAAVRVFQELVRRRSAGREPVAYLLGTKGFRHIDLSVDGRVLVPRPETELLVEVALGLPAGARVLDVGTGSGAVALALASERPDLRVTGSDVSADALAVAAGNRERLGLDVELVQADLLDGLGEDWDAVLANPPYVAERDAGTLPRDVAGHEPRAALFAGDDGLEVIRRLIPQAAATRARLLAIEVGAGQAPVVAALAADAGFADVETHRDLAGIERVVAARRQPATDRGATRR